MKCVEKQGVSWSVLLFQFTFTKEKKKSLLFSSKRERKSCLFKKSRDEFKMKYNSKVHNIVRKWDAA